jgi:hypothetical protein
VEYRPNLSEPVLHFPPGSVDEYGEQIDLRKENSWTMKIDKVNPVEVLEVQAINNIAPTLLISRLLPIMEMPKKFNFKTGHRQQRYDKDEVVAYR